MAASIEREGFGETSVADVVRLAKTSRRTFYEHFEDRHACFLALFDATNEQTMQRIGVAVRPDSGWDEQVDAAVGAFIDSVCDHPALYRSFARELPGLGRDGAERGRAAVERFAELLVQLVEASRREHPGAAAHSLSLEMAIVIVAGIRELTIVALEDNRDLQQLRVTMSGIVKAIMGAAVLGT